MTPFAKYSPIPNTKSWSLSDVNAESNYLIRPVPEIPQGLCDVLTILSCRFRFTTTDDYIALCAFDQFVDYMATAVQNKCRHDEGVSWGRH